MLVRIGHSADPDDAFMVWALASGTVDPRGFDFDLAFTPASSIDFLITQIA